MPYDKESGKKYGSPKEALADALPEGADASEVMDKLKDMGYSLEPAAGAVGVAIEMEAEPKEDSKKESKEEKAEGPEKSKDEKELEPGGSEDIKDEEKVEISMGMIGEPEPMSKKRDKVAGDLMEKFKKGMV